MLFSSLIFWNGSPNAGNLLLWRKWYPMSQNSKTNKTLQCDKQILKSLSFTASPSSFHSSTGTCLSGKNFVWYLELVLGISLFRPMQQDAVSMGMLYLYLKCFRASFRHMLKRRPFSWGSRILLALLSCLC